MRPLTSSEMRAFQLCPRGWWISSYLNLRRVHELPSLPNIGTLVHAGLEKYYAGDCERPEDIVIERGAKLLEEFPELEKQISKDVDMARIMLEGYLPWLEEEGADAEFEMIGSEQMVEVALEGTPYRLRGKIDARLRRLSDGALLQLEHKTVGDLVTIPKYAQSAPQFLTYDLLAFLKAREDNEPDVRTDGVIINMLRRVKRTPTAHPPFYGRYVVQHNDDELRNHFRHVVSIARSMERASADLDAGRDHHEVVPPSVDKSHTYMCACAPLGNMFDDGSDWKGYLAEFYESWNPMERYGAAEAEEAS